MPRGGDHLVGAIALDRGLHALAVEGDVAVAGVARPRIDHLRDLVAGDRVAGRERDRCRGGRDTVRMQARRAAAAQRRATARAARAFNESRHGTLPRGRSSMWPVNGSCAAVGEALDPAVAGIGARGTSVLPSRKKSTSFGGSVSSSGVLSTSPGPRRAHQTRRDDDDEVGLVLLIGLRWRTARPAPARCRARAAARSGSVLLFCSSPPITKLWPSRSSTVVEARRTISAGTEMPLPTATRVVGVDLADLRLDLEIDQAVAEHGRREGKADAVFLVVDGDLAERTPDTGIGYSPPARKLAVSPDSATRLGSARLRATPFCSSALISTSAVHAACDQAADHEAERRRAGEHASGDSPTRCAPPR